MPRKGPAPRRPLVADPVYNSLLVTQLINKILLRASASSPSALFTARSKAAGRRPAPTPW